VQISIAVTTASKDHLVGPAEAVGVAMARQ
jgi:hypothetical protein